MTGRKEKQRRHSPRKTPHDCAEVTFIGGRPGSLEERGMVSQGDMDQQEPNPHHKNINPSQPITPEKPI